MGAIAEKQDWLILLKLYFMWTSKVYVLKWSTRWFTEIEGMYRRDVQLTYQRGVTSKRKKIKMMACIML